MKSYITSIGTAVPKYRNKQSTIAEFMSAASEMNEEETSKLNMLYRASGIGFRQSVIPDFGMKNGDFTFFPNTPGLEPFPTVGERMKLYEREALPLALNAVQDCLNNIEINLSDITHLITISCSGMYAPGLDIELIEKLGLSRNVQRTCINFMGCYAAFNGLKTADAICRSQKNAKALVVCVELCTIHYQKTKDWDQILSNALFSDGAAAVLVSAEKPATGKLFSMENFHCDLAPEGKGDMAWHISDHGFEMTLSSYVPDLIKSGIGQLTEDLLAKLGMASEEIDFYAIHPGGKKILEAIETVLHIEKTKNRFAHHVLREYGNMSSPTVLFVLKEILQQIGNSDDQKNILSFAFGPGLTLESMMLKVHANVEVKKEKVFLEKEIIAVS
ncbi:MAG TPA: type III polyketide synthase [Cytophagaceae bacterium]|jgi:predicted naringenin-chalcone synthase|nr:type III polyketide synthase [Cytophagaceae bacterium]